MLKTIFKRVVWLARGTSIVLGLAVMLALVFGVSTMALAAVPGDPFKLGKKNTVDNLSQLVGSVDNAMLRITNDNAGTSAAALELQVKQDKPPITVNDAAGTATGLSADELDGKDSTQIFGPASFYARVTTKVGAANVRTDFERSCDAGDVVVGGGVSGVDDGSKVTNNGPVSDSSGNPPRTWQASWISDSNGDQVAVHATCADVG
jgi:hypothetical protein